MTLLSLVASVLFATAPPADSVTIDSQQTFEKAMEGTSAPQEIIRSLEMIDVEYYGFDGKLHRGQIIVHKDLAKDITAIFKEIKRMRFPVESVIPVKFDLPDNGTTMDTLNNSMGFHYRVISTFQTDKLSNHAYGRAVDINPFQNPAILKSGKIIPEGGSYDPKAKGTILLNSEIVKLFRKYGWQWGGTWRSLKDYMHFEKQ